MLTQGNVSYHFIQLQLDPLFRILNQCEYNDNSQAWTSLIMLDLTKARRIGDIYLAHSDEGELIGGAATFPPGHEVHKDTTVAERRATEEALSEEQKDFRMKVGLLL